MNPEKPKITCLPNGPYYLLNALTPQTIPNLVDSNGDPCAGQKNPGSIPTAQTPGRSSKPSSDAPLGRSAIR